MAHNILRDHENTGFVAVNVVVLNGDAVGCAFADFKADRAELVGNQCFTAESTNAPGHCRADKGVAGNLRWREFFERIGTGGQVAGDRPV